MIKNAKYIWINNDGTFQSNQFLFFRKSFIINKKDVQDITMDIYADSRYVLYLNGELVGRGPIPSDPRYATYDNYHAEKHLKDGENVLGVIVCYYGNQTCEYIQGNPELILSTDIISCDGTIETLVTDNSWKCFVPLCWPIGGPRRSIWKSMIELFDAREYPVGWEYPGYCDDFWTNAVELEEAPRHRIGWLKPRDIQYLHYNRLYCHEVYRCGKVLFLQDSSAIFKNRLRRSIREVTTAANSDSCTLPMTVNPYNAALYCIFDFKKDVVGRTGFRLDAPAGTVVDVVFREIEEKGLMQLSVAGMVNWKRYICREGEQVWLSFEPEAFRYLQLVVHGNSAPAQIIEVFVEEQRYPSERKGNFECSDEVLNKLWETGANTIQLCMQEVYTDNPVREMAPWSGDIEYAKLVSYYVTGDYKLAARGLRQMSYGQEKSGRMPMLWPSGLPYSVSMQRCIVPEGMAGFELPHHSLQWVSSIWRYYMYSGDRELLEELFGKAVNACRWFTEKCGADGLLYHNEKWEDRWDWVDWEGQKNIWASLNLFYYCTLYDLRNMAIALNDEGTGNEADELMIKLKVGFIKKYWSDEYEAFVDCYTESNEKSEPFFSEITLSLAFGYDLVPEKHKDKVLQRLAGGLPDCSPVHKYHPYFAYSIHEMHDRVLQEFRTKWIKMWSVGGTGTFQEVWELDPDSGNSCCCQSASAVPAYYLPAYILGVRPVGPGFEEFIVDPVSAGLEWAKGAVPTPYGLVHVEWEKEDNGFDLKVEVPKGYKIFESKKKENGMDIMIYKFIRD